MHCLIGPYLKASSTPSIDFSVVGLLHSIKANIFLLASSSTANAHMSCRHSTSQYVQQLGCAFSRTLSSLSFLYLSCPSSLHSLNQAESYGFSYGLYASCSPFL